MTTAGTVETLRVTGVPGGHPAEQESNVKIRWVDTALEVMSDKEVPLINVVGGINQFSADNTKIEWVLYDLWQDRLELSGEHVAGATTFTLDGDYAHRFPRGTVLKVVGGSELVWIQAQATASTLTVVRGFAGTTAATHASETEFRVAGFGEVEGRDVVLRGSALREVPHNFFSIYKTGVSESWMQSEASIYTRSGPTTPEMMADAIAEAFVAIEAQIFEGQRYAGSGDNDPPQAGGIRFFGTAANGATVIDCDGELLGREHLDQAFDESYMRVGMTKMAKTVVCGIKAKRRLWNAYIVPFAEGGGGAHHMETQARTNFTRLENEYGTFEILGPYKRVQENELWIINPALIQTGTFGRLGRLHEFDLPSQGDYSKKGIYGAYSNKIKGIPGLVRIHNFITEAEEE